MECKIIKASAGTGKTFRLSLEFIALLIKHKNTNLQWNDILTITFTKKATAEIRQRIFSHLESIIAQSDEGKMLTKIVSDLAGLSFDSSTIEYLEIMYREMKLNKSKLQISTIDSFVNQIFKTIISPYLGIERYEINDKININYFGDLFQTILKEGEEVYPFFKSNETYNPEQYQSFIDGLLQFRWMFFMVEKTTWDQDAFEQLCNLYEEQLVDTTQDFLNTFFCNKLEGKYENLKDFLKDAFRKSLAKYCDLSSANPKETMQALFTSPEFLQNEFSTLLDGKQFWMKKAMVKSSNEILEEAWKNYCTNVSNYLIIKLILPEQNLIRKMMSSLYDKYDEIKFRDKVFTYNDISFYTFKYLYDPEISMIDSNTVTNQFYEFLSRRINFMLIDEFQDTSILQWKIMLPIIQEILSGDNMKEHCGVTVVGDEKQSIYRWRGGERDLLVKLGEILPQAKEQVLDTSYRSNPMIIDFVNTVFAKDTTQEFFTENSIDWHYEKVKCAKETTDGYINVSFENLSHLDKGSQDLTNRIFEYAKNEIIPLILDGSLDPAKTAVLARKNQELDAFALALEDSGIPYTKDSSKQLFLHEAIQPFLWVLRFVIHASTLDCVKLLRSDLFRIYPNQLTNINFDNMLTNLDWNEFWESNSENEYTETLRSVYELNRDNLRLWILEVAKKLGWVNTFKTESAAKNFQKFLALADNFLETNHEYPKTLSGFLSYIEVLNERKELEQVSVEEDKAITLLTVHKSKGLEYDTVILLWNVSSRNGFHGKQLHKLLDFNNDYSEVNKSIYTYQYKKVLAESNYKDLIEKDKIQNIIEELNIIYVAITRPVENLFFYFPYKSVSKGEPVPLATFIDKLKLNSTSNWFAKTCYYKLGYFELKNDIFHSEIGCLKRVNIEEKMIENLDGNVLSYEIPEFDNSEKDFKNLDFASSLLENRSRMKGIVAHHYLSFIERNDQTSFDFALAMTNNTYGSMLPKDVFKEVIASVQNFVNNNSYYFSEEWDAVYNEFPIYDDNKEFRLDRFQINEKKKIILIIDYKTGEINDVRQLENYKKLLTIALGDNYSDYKITTMFLKFSIH